MNRADLIEYIASEMDTSKAEADRFLSTFLDAIYSNVRKEGVKIAGLGSFTAAKRKARVGRNPQTGEEIKIPAKWVPVFKAGATLKESVKKR